MFSWLFLHRKILTMDILAVRGWPHDPICQLCLRALETACHLCKGSPFTVKVWNLVHAWSLHLCPQALTPEMHSSVDDSWEAMIVGVDKKTKCSAAEDCCMWSRMSGRSRMEKFSQTCASLTLRSLISPMRISVRGIGVRCSHTDDGSKWLSRSLLQVRTLSKVSLCWDSKCRVL
jgi:hypothetical protein